MQVIAGGKSSSHSCQASAIFPACASGLLQVTANLATRSTAVVRKLNLVTTPKLPLPPPRNAQNRSASCCALAARILPDASTISIELMLSQASPKGRPKRPKPPPSEWPATPTGKQVPAG